MKTPIHSQKHYHQITLSTATTGAETATILLEAKGSPTSGLDEVKEGAIVKAVYIELWLIGSVSDQFFTLIFSKIPSGLALATYAEMAALGTYENKKNVLFTSQGLASNDGIGNPVAVMRGWFKIPRGKQRMGLGDKLAINVASRGSGTITYCGFATYKEYT